MNTGNNMNEFRTPSRKSLIYSSIAAAVAAIIILVIVVLPAEYNIDPSGIGTRLGLTELSLPAVKQTVTNNNGATGGEQAARSVSEPKTSGQHQNPYRTDVVEINMAPGDELEYKTTLAQGEPLLYSWETDDSTHFVYYDFHGEPAAVDSTHPKDYFMSYEAKQDGASSSRGYLIAPFTGNHGWYMQNFNDHPVTVRLKISGNYSWHGFLARWNNYAQAEGMQGPE